MVRNTDPRFKIQVTSNVNGQPREIVACDWWLVASICEWLAMNVWITEDEEKEHT